MRIAYFGGSFDPPHVGHLAIAQAAEEALSLDRILFAPVGLQPLKPSGSTASFEDRVAMTRLAIEGRGHFEVSLADAPHGEAKANYTIDTLIQLKRRLEPGTELFLLLGADSFRTLHHWHRAREIPFAATLVVASRPEHRLIDLHKLLPGGVDVELVSSSRARSLLHYTLAGAGDSEAEMYVLPELSHEVSATELRRLIEKMPERTGGVGAVKGLEELVPEAVLEYIRAHGLYKRG